MLNLSFGTHFQDRGWGRSDFDRLAVELRAAVATRP
jgi:hypothetical protein